MVRPVRRRLSRMMVCGVGALAGFAGTHARAQSAPGLPPGLPPPVAVPRPTQDPGQRLLQDQRDQQRRDEIQQTPTQIAVPEQSAIPNLPAGADIESLPDVEPMFRITDIEFDGDQVLSKRQMDAIKQPFLGKQLGRNRINLLLRRITEAFIAHGYITTRAYLGAQNLSSGKLTIKVVAGHVAAFTLNGNPNVNNGPTTGSLSLTINGGDGAFNNAGGQVLAQDNLGLSAVNMALDPSQGTISQGGQLSITAGSINVGGTWNYGGLGVTVDGLNGITNTGTMNGTAPLTLTTGGTFTNYGQVTGQDVTVNGTVNNVAGALLHAGDALAINGDTTNRGTVEAVNTLTVSGGSYDNQGATTQSQGNVTFNLGGTLQNTGGSIFAGNNVTINAGAVVNDQAPATGQTDTGAVVVNDPAFLLSTIVGTEYVITGTDYRDDIGYPVYTTSAATLAELLSPTGNPSTAAPIVTSGSFTIEGGVVGAWSYGDGAADSSPGEVWVLDTPNNSGGASCCSNTYFTFTLPTVYEETTSAQQGASGVISAGNNVSITVGNLSNQGGQIAASGNVSLNVSSLENNALASTQTSSSREWVDPSQLNSFLASLVNALSQQPFDDASVDPQDISSTAPTLVAGQGGTVQSQDLHPTVEIEVNSSGTNSVTSTLSANNPTGMVAAGSNLTISGGNLVNAGLLYAGNNVIVNAASLTNQGGNQQNSSSQVGCASGVPSTSCDNGGSPRGNNPDTTTFSYSQSDATIYAGNDLVIAAGQINNTYGNLLAGHNIVIGGVGTTASSTTPAQTLNNTSGNIVAGNNITLDVSGAITNNLPPPVPVHQNYGSQQQYAGCMTAGGYKESYCEAYVDQQSGSSSVISAGNNLQINAGSLTNIGSLISAGTSATINVSGPVVSEAQTLNAYWHSEWVQETGDFSPDKRHNTWACGSVAECTALYGSAYTSVGGTIDPPTPVGNIAATIEAPNLSITSGGVIQNVGNVIGTSVALTGQKLINGITTANTYTPSTNSPSQVISLSPLTMPGLNVSTPRSVGTGSLPTPVAGQASYVDGALSEAQASIMGPQNLLNALPANLQPSSTLFYYNPQEEDLLLQQAALQQTGQASFITGLSYNSTTGASITDQEKQDLYGNALAYAEQNNLQLGTALTQTQINALTEPMLWYVEQTVPDPTCTATGTATCPTITALMPQVYLPQNASALSAGGNIEASNNLTLNFGNAASGGSITNTGTITSGGTLTVNTGTLTNEANQVNVGSIWNSVKGGYTNTTGTEVQPGGFMSAANMDLNVQTLNQVGGALQELNSDGTVNQAGTQQVLAALQQQLGGNFTQSTVSNNLNTSFTAEGGFGIGQLVGMIAAVVLSVEMGPEMFAMYNGLIDPIALAAISPMLAVAGSAAATGLAAATTAMVAGAASQLISTGSFNFTQDLEGAAVSGLTAGLTQGLLGSTGINNLGNGITQANSDITLANIGATAENIGAQALIGAASQTLVEGGSFGTALADNAANDAAAVGANAIGTVFNGSTPVLSTSDPLYALSHAALGCAASAAEGTGCVGGAIGGAVSAGLNPIIDANGNIPPAMLAGIETLVSGSVAGALGFNAQGAVTAAQNETLNNWLNHVIPLLGGQSQAQQLNTALSGCDSGNAAACATAATLMQTSTSNDQALASACQSPSSVACLYQKSVAYLEGNNIQTVNGVTTAIAAPQPTYVAPSQAAATLDNMLSSPLASILGGVTYGLGGSTSTAYYVSSLGVATEGVAAGVAGLGGTTAINVISEATNSGQISSVGEGSQPSFVFRGDGRTPDVIFNEGFQPSGTSTDLSSYVQQGGPSNFISTSTSSTVAQEFAAMQQGGYVFTINGQSQGLNVNAILGGKSPYPDEFEIAVPGGILPSDIMGAQQVGANGNLVGTFIKNPNYKPN